MNPISYNTRRESMADPAIVEEICKNIKQMRLAENMSQQELADRAGISRITVSRMEAGRPATLLTMVQVLRALDKLSLLDIFQVKEPEISPMQLWKQQQSKRQKASPKSKKGNNNAPDNYTSEW